MENILDLILSKQFLIGLNFYKINNVMMILQKYSNSNIELVVKLDKVHMRQLE